MTDHDRRLTELLDREAIRDCINRYCRGIDRADEATLRSSYWPDATDCHGSYNGPVEGFFQWALSVFKTGARNIHQVSNVLITFKGDAKAVVESSFLALQRGPDRNGATRQFMMAGRYCDVFEKRGDEWRVAHRVVAFDWVEEQPVPDQSEEVRFASRKPIGGSFPNDPIYELLAQSA
jgi:ketosteroid isomerase-like protein